MSGYVGWKNSIQSGPNYCHEGSENCHACCIFPMGISEGVRQRSAGYQIIDPEQQVSTSESRPRTAGLNSWILLGLFLIIICSRQ